MFVNGEHNVYGKRLISIRDKRGIFIGKRHISKSSDVPVGNGDIDRELDMSGKYVTWTGYRNSIYRGKT